MKPGIIFSLVLGASIFLFTRCNKADSPPPSVTDTEGNVYKTVRIGEQIWMAENLRTTKFSDGISIPVVSDQPAWSSLDSPGMCWYNNEGDSTREIYGALYNFHAVASGKVCPEGWHVPSADDWQRLRDFLGDTLVAGGLLKEAGTLHWAAPNTGAVNSTGFNALPAGIRYFEGTFTSRSWFTSYWTSTEYENDKGWYLSLYYSDAVLSMNNISRRDGFSIRCIKD